MDWENVERDFLLCSEFSMALFTLKVFLSFMLEVLSDSSGEEKQTTV